MAQKGGKNAGRPRGRPPQNNKNNSNNSNNGDNNIRNEANPVVLNVMPFVLVITAVYILVSFFMDENVGGVGGVGVFVKNTFYGLFGSAALLIPAGLCNTAFFLKKDAQSGFFRYRLIFSLLCIILFSSMFHLASGESAKEAGYNIGMIFTNGQKSVGGGVLGGYLAQTLLKIVGSIGAWIFTISLTVVVITFILGYTPAEIVKMIIRFIRDFGSKTSGFKRNIIVKTPDPENRFRAKTHRYKITSHINTPHKNNNNRNNKKFQPDIPLDSPGENKKSKSKEIYISDNPFANDFSDEAEAVRSSSEKNAGLKLNYETPLMIPSEELFDPDNKNNKNISEIINKNSDFEDLFETKGETDAADKNTDINIEADESFGDIKIVESLPQLRGDEPDIDENSINKKETPETINFETSKMFEEDDIPVKKEYKLPPVTYLTKDESVVNVDISEELNTTAKKLTDTLASFGVKTKIYGVSRGPSVTRYEISPDSGTKVNSIVNLVNDISLSLAAEIRIEAPIPGKSAIGIEVPNKSPETVHLRSLLEDSRFTNAASRITIALGMDVGGNAIYSDIAKMPHLLIAGATGMGKSICMNSIITSILYKASPDEVKLILIDPKKVELNIYNGIPHLLVPVVSDPKKAAGALSWAVNEMENRYVLIEEKGVRDFRAYNESIAGDPFAESLTQIVVIIDELADLMLTAPADVEQSINRIAAKARAAGIHLIIATQRPSVDVITGLIKANIPTRIAFTVVAPQDSRTIINMGGAEKLIGRGDMLYVPTGSKPIRVQGAFVSEKDVLNIVEFWKKQSDGQYDEDILNEIEQEAARCNTKGAKIKDTSDSSADDEELEREPMLKPAIEIAIDMGTVSTSLLQRKLSLGYARAARIVDKMEKMNVIGPFEGSKPRRVLITRQDFIEMTMKNENLE
ncbi:MAG: DNA translocase FtsK [Oscillospiraceae bacterium]|nr:DNA translocase FtsK [Oscillospiraceae bacterium]